MTTQVYALKILRTEVRRGEDGTDEVVVLYHGKGEAAELHEPLESADLQGIITTCERLARRIFHDEFRLNEAVSLGFALEDENGIKIWHTRPNLYLKCPLTMTMKWSCHHLSQVYKTMTTLGVIELPSELALEGNALGVQETARVVMDSMATGVEFMGNVMLMRNTIDHKALSGAHS